MKDALLIALLVGGAYLLLKDRQSSSNNNIPSSGNRTIDRVEKAFNSGARIAREGKSLYEDIF